MRIHWIKNKYGDYIGGVNRQGGLFSITWHTKRDDPNWLLRTTLPSMGHLRAKDDDENMLKLEAEAWLADFVASLGAAFPD